MAKVRSRSMVARPGPKVKPQIKTHFMDSEMGKASTQESPIKVEKVGQDGSDVQFRASSDTVTAYDGAVDLQNWDYTHVSNYELDGAQPDIGGLSITDDGEQVPTTKVNRTRFGIIMSTPEESARAKPYIVPLVKHVFEAQTYIEIIDTSISQLRRVPKEITKPTAAPVLETVQCYPGFGTLDGEYSDGYSIQVLPELGEPSLQVAANHPIILMSKAYSYRNEVGTRIRTGLTFTWKFSADGIGTARNQIVSNGPVLRVTAAQLQQRGRYHVDVTNEKGTTSSKGYFINVLGGLLSELSPSIIGEETIYIPTGNYVRDTFHDEEVTKFDDYYDYIESEGRWIKLEWVDGMWSEIPGGAQQSVLSQGEEDTTVTKIDGGISSAEKVTQVHGGIYSKRADNPTVYFNAPGGVTYTFSTPEEYFDHRSARGLPRDWSGIKITG